MDFSKLSAGDKRLLIAAAVALLGGLVSIIDRWGVGGIIGGLAALGAILVLLQPQLSPAMKLPAPKATLLLGLGGIAAVGFILSALQYLEDVFSLGRIFTILFDIGLVAAIVLAYLAWLGYKAAQGTAAAASPAATESPAAMESPAATEGTAAPADEATMERPAAPPPPAPPPPAAR
ncbi:MAG TPA: hypothetical protein VMQ65_00110 [Candidatus Limnocylindria bacterium]|nr:hypothetical protein [Candidatus Limnocylindria bacterium]